MFLAKLAFASSADSALAMSPEAATSDMAWVALAASSRHMLPTSVIDACRL